METDGESENYESEFFSENDLYGSSHSDMGKHKYNSIDNEERTKNYSAYIEEVEKQQILPRRMGFQSKKEKFGNMNLKSFYIGETYASPFSQGIKDHNLLKKINLSSWSLKDDGFIKIIKNAPKHLRELDVSENSSLGIEWYRALAEYLDDRDQKYNSFSSNIYLDLNR